jgi:hypothetical protein
MINFIYKDPSKVVEFKPLAKLGFDFNNIYSLIYKIIVLYIGIYFLLTMKTYPSVMLSA